MLGVKRRTAVRITGEGVGQNLFVGQEVPLGYLFLPDTRPGPLRRMCRTFQTSAHAFSCRWPRPFLPYSEAGPEFPTPTASELTKRLYLVAYQWLRRSRTMLSLQCNRNYGTHTTPLPAEPKCTNMEHGKEPLAVRPQPLAPTGPGHSTWLWLYPPPTRTPPTSAPSRSPPAPSPPQPQRCLQTPPDPSLRIPTLDLGSPMRQDHPNQDDLVERSPETLVLRYKHTAN